MASFNLEDYQDVSNPEVRRWLEFLKAQQSEYVPESSPGFEEHVVNKYKPLYDIINPQPNKTSVVKDLVAQPRSMASIPQDNTGSGSVRGVKVGDQGGIIPTDAELAGLNAPKMGMASVPGEVPSIRPTLAQTMNELQFGQNNVASQDALKQAIDQKNSTNLLANLGRSADLISGGIAAQRGVKLQQNPVYDAIEKQGQQAITDYQSQVEFQKQDPNSSYSKGLKDYFKTKLGIDVKGDASAAELEKLMPFAVREFEAQQERVLRKEQRELDRIQRAEDKKEDRELKKILAGTAADNKRTAAEEKATAKLSSEQNSFIERTSKQMEKHGTNLATLRNAKASIDAAVKNPSSIKDVGALYSFIKALDPNSVVREGEIGLANRASGLFGSAILKLSQLTSDPKLITPKNLKDIQDSISQLYDIANNEYDLRRQGAYKRATSRGIPEDRFGEFDPYAGEGKRSLQSNDVAKQKVQAFMKSNPSVKTEEEAMDILKKAGRL